VLVIVTWTGCARTSATPGDVDRALPATSAVASAIRPIPSAVSSRPSTTTSSCEPAETSPHWPPWPEAGVNIRGENGQPSSLRLTRSEAEAIRCALLAHYATPAAKERVASDFASEAETWRVGAPGVGYDGPQIGAYRVRQGDSEADIVLYRTLRVAAYGRYGLSARLIRHDGAWSVQGFGAVVSHARR
jgi:hypothetical protein